MKKSFDFRNKICLIGDAGVGKTSLIQQFVYDRFSDEYISTIGVKVSKKIMEFDIDNEQYRSSLQIWDTMGQMEYRPILIHHFCGTDGAFIVCDITNRNSLYNIEPWVKLLFSITGRIPVIVLVNKIDLHDELIDSKVPDEPYFERELEGYFPPKLRKHYPEEIASHRLRRNIIATRLSNVVNNRGGSTMSIRSKMSSRP